MSSARRGPKKEMQPSLGRDSIRNKTKSGTRSYGGNAFGHDAFIGNCNPNERDYFGSCVGELDGPNGGLMNSDARDAYSDNHGRSR